MNENLRHQVLELQRDIAKNLKAITSIDRGDKLTPIFSLILKFDSLASRLYEARATLPPHDPLVRQTEDIVSSLSQELVLLQRGAEDGRGLYDQFIVRYRSLWRSNISLFLFTVFIFIGSCFLGYELTTQAPEFVSVVLPQTLIEDILQKKFWFKELEKYPILGGMRIAINNIGVSIKCFLGGALLGLGGAFLLIFNGVMFGAILGFCGSHGFREPLLQFVTGHGPLELSIIVASAFAGFIFGAAFYKRPVKLFRFRMAKAATEAGYLLMGILPWLFLAAFIESFISPWDFISFKLKMIIGLSCAVFFWSWTFFEGFKNKKTDVI